MREPFAIRVGARGYEVDMNGHIAGTVLLQYAQHARWELLRAAGVEQGELLAGRVSPVSLEERIRFREEVHAGDQIEVTCRFVWGQGKTFRIEQELRRPDGAATAEVTNVGGLMHLDRRKLVPDPRSHWRAVARSPDLLGL